MPRSKGGQTLELSEADNIELLALCADNNEAEKKWLGGVMLRYGMAHSKAALDMNSAASDQRTRKRRLV